MFTGLVETMGQVHALELRTAGVRLVIDAPAIAEGIQIGDSIANNGCCLTVVQINATLLGFDAGPETLACTNLGQKQVGDNINLERSVCLGDRLGGHLVTGHVDGLGELVKREDDQDWSTFWFKTPPNLSRQMASKGSITVDGISLTLVDVTDAQFSVALIPHTLEVTTFGKLQVGDQVNLETDLLAKYVERQMTAISDASSN
ncbi:MAG TPA: riboflavin synthase [Planctomycetaceae bacterium]|jgi:riboflavin synthase|nr:riboflavin synthase [Planctomycetaceae bacterium]